MPKKPETVMTDPNYTTLAISSNITTTSQSSSRPSLMYINLLVPPILLVLGVIFNSFTILTMRTRHFRKVSTSVYLKVGAINDALALMISLTAHWLYVNFPDVYVRTSSSHIMCKFFNFYGAGNNDFGIIVIVSMTAERAFVIASPLGAAKNCSVSRAWKIVVALLVIVIVKNCHFFIASDIVPAGRTDRLCDVFLEAHGDFYRKFYTDFHPWFHLFYIISCAITIIISNSIIIHNVRKSFGFKHSRKHQAWRHLVPMLLGESLLLVIFTFPFTFHLSLLSIRITYNPDLYSDEKTAAVENLVFSVTFYMLYSNKCVNFFMYCITGKHFRDGLVSVLFKCACQGDDQKRMDRFNTFRSTTSTMSFNKSRARSLNDFKSSRSKTVSDTHNEARRPFSACERLKQSLWKKRLAKSNTNIDTSKTSSTEQKESVVKKGQIKLNPEKITNAIEKNLSESKKTKRYDETHTCTEPCHTTSICDTMTSPPLEIFPWSNSRTSSQSIVSSSFTRSVLSTPTPEKDHLYKSTVFSILTKPSIDSLSTRPIETEHKSNLLSSKQSNVSSKVIQSTNVLRPQRQFLNVQTRKETVLAPDQTHHQTIESPESGSMDTVCLYVDRTLYMQAFGMGEKTPSSLSFYI